jgi:hypothetical protein
VKGVLAMKKGFVICILLVMLLSSCGQKKVNIPIGSDHSTKEAASSVAVEEDIVYSVRPMADYSSPGSINGLVRVSDFIAVVRVAAQNPTFVTAGHDPSEFEYLKTMEYEPQMDLMMSIRSSYTLELISVLKTDDETIQNGDSLDMCIPGGVCRGYELQTDYTQLKPGEEYIIFLTRRNFVYEGEPSYTIASREVAAVNLNEFDTQARERATKDTSSIYSGLDNVAELKKEIISAIKTEAMVAVGTTE